MSDIFEIKSVNIVLKYKDQEYKFADPNIRKKVELQKKQAVLQKQKDSMSSDEYTLATMDLAKAMIKLHLPLMSDAVLDDMGNFEMLALVEKLNELAAEKFGASVQKVEGK